MKERSVAQPPADGPFRFENIGQYMHLNTTACRNLLIVSGFACFSAQPAFAQREMQSDDLALSIGAGVIIGPEYLGSDDLRVLPVPVLDIRKGRFFLNAREGLGADFVKNSDSTFRLSGSIFARFGRDETDDPVRLRGLGDMNVAPQAKLSASKAFGNAGVRASLAHDFGASNGTTLDIGASYRIAAGKSVMLFGGPGLHFADDKFSQAFFGVSPSQAIRGGRAAYRAKGGLYQLGISAGANWMIDSDWSVTAFGGLNYLVGDAGNSPVVARREQPSAGLLVTRRF
ncbi:MAG: hypothetical protein COA41_17810 [Sphingopyxis sp.]|nr:MAG: hypothetical protein COA41_17810 [Sphingopyxis sp.]